MWYGKFGAPSQESKHDSSFTPTDATMVDQVKHRDSFVALRREESRIVTESKGTGRAKSRRMLA